MQDLIMIECFFLILLQNGLASLPSNYQGVVHLPC